MESPNTATRRSRLPVPRATLSVRSSPSRDSLTSPNSITLPRLRGTPSRDQLSSTGKRGSSIGTVIYSPLKAQTQGDSNRDSSLQRPLDRSNSEQQDHVLNPPERSTPRKLQNPASPAAPIEDEAILRKPRLSLSERTMETLSQLPSSPAARRRDSNFF